MRYSGRCDDGDDEDDVYCALGSGSGSPKAKGEGGVRRNGALCIVELSKGGRSRQDVHADALTEGKLTADCADDAEREEEEEKEREECVLRAVRLQ